ncbi:hypothetical protein B0H14DRAFT_2712997 [Mycena olivaceomarginata]|nr:hypothetical protein B0H14DRAFT_2793770 [Mycena olivaceomarginata]KAJ7877217.1 hypothetical protein B0H14DRAFT_2712997 [Mycena olivaceomarginata]
MVACISSFSIFQFFPHNVNFCSSALFFFFSASSASTLFCNSYSTPMSSKEATVESSLSSSESEDPGKNFGAGLPGGFGGFRQRG